MLLNDKLKPYRLLLASQSPRRRELMTGCGVAQMSQIAEPGREPGKYQLDLWAACYETLKEAGIPPKSIQLSGVCTCCHKDLLFSHRATAGKRGNLNGFIWKKCS